MNRMKIVEKMNIKKWLSNIITVLLVGLIATTTMPVANIVADNTLNINKVFEASNGNDYNVTVTYGEDALIPEGSTLEIKEIIKEDRNYEEYVNKTVEVLEWGEDYFHTFSLLEIAIIDKDGNKVIPKAKVDAKIELISNTKEDISVDETQVVVLNEADNNININNNDTETVVEEGNDFSIDFDTEKIEQSNEETTIPVIAVAQVVKEKQIKASDDQTYSIKVTYSADSGLPLDAELDVKEILLGDDGYEIYVNESTSALETNDISYIRVFDITIVDPKTGEHYEPNNNVTVSIELMDTEIDSESKIDVVHINETVIEKENEENEIIYESTPLETTVTENNTIDFETDGFSVYVIIKHEGEEVETARVEFHFLSPLAEGAEGVAEDNIVYYTSTPYEFKNTALAIQTSLIVKNGDTVETIEAPLNQLQSYFYGWYTVDFASKDGENIKYSWPDDTKRVELDRTIEISNVVKNSDGAVTSLTWKVDEASQTVTTNIDEEGCAHVYLAPVYSNYFFVNFHLGSRDETSTSGSIMTRKMIVLGNSNQTQVLISDVDSPSKDVKHKKFVGWEYNAGTEEEPNWVLEETIANIGSDSGEIEKIEKYITVTDKTYELYPVFVEVRYVNFNTGASHNGSTYKPPLAVKTSDSSSSTEFPVSELGVASRSGYIFKGWYLEQDSNHNGTGYQLTDQTGKVINSAESHEVRDGGGNLLYKIENGKLYVYTALEDLTVYAKWQANNEATYKVIIWKQKVTDDKNTTLTPEEYQANLDAWIAADSTHTKENYTGEVGKTYDYYTHFERTAAGDAVVSPSSEDLNYVNSNPNGDFTGFKLGSYNSNVQIDPQGSTVLNVYYDRQLITFIFNYDDNYFYRLVEEQLDENKTYYALINGNYIPLARSNAQYYYLVDRYSNPYSGTVYERKNNRWNTVDYASLEYGNQYYSRESTNNQYRLSFVAYSIDNSFYEIIYTNVMTGLFMQPLSMYGYTWPTEISWRTSDSPTYGTINLAPVRYYFSENVDAVYYKRYNNPIEMQFYLQDTLGNYPNTPNATRLYNTGTITRPIVFANQFLGLTPVRYQIGNNNPVNITDENMETEITVNNTIKIYFARNRYSLTFDANYPATEKSREPNPVVYNEIPFENELIEYKDEHAPNSPSDIYRFDGWYEDASGTKPFDFANTTMPAANKIIYAKWSLVKYRIRINPNGGIIDHIDYRSSTIRNMLEPTGLDSTVYNSSYATYFNNTATEYIGTDDDINNPYVQISDAEAALMDEGVYRYVNMQFNSNYGGSYAADARNALYILDTEESISAYYNYYKYIIETTNDGTVLPRSLWESLYLSEAKYRRTRNGERQEFIGWYEVDEEGNIELEPFDFSEPTSHATTLIALWSLNGGYKIQYTTEYYADNNVLVTGDLDTWIDPSGNQTYYDSAITQAMQEPTAIRVNGALSNDYQFRGWQIVKVTTINNVPHYTPLEPGVYYTAGQPLTVEAKYSDENMIIHMQAVYEKRSEAYRRPEVTNLVLDASKDAANSGTGSINSSVGNLPSWGYTGTSTIEGNQILFGDIQSNAAVHLYKYATELTKDSKGNTLDPTGLNFFKHSLDYKLLGFDEDAVDDDFIADYSADGVVAVSPNESHTLYAVWEPMVYVTFKNNTGTGKPITFSLSSSDISDFVVNVVKGEYEREDLSSQVNNIKLADGGTIVLAIPYGEEKTLTVSGQNNLGVGKMLSATYKFGEAERDIDDCTDIPNNDNYSFSEILKKDNEGIIITFTSEQAPKTLLLVDNYNKDGTGGGTKEYNFKKTESGFIYYTDENDGTFDLPSTSTRIGYEFLGWDSDYTSTSPQYNSTNRRINNLTSFFGDDDIKTLYGVWTVNVKAQTVFVWKEVPEPGDKNKEFNFNINFSGSFSYYHYEWVLDGFSSGFKWVYYADNISSSNSRDTYSSNVDFSLKHGEYLEIFSTKDESNYPQINIEIVKRDSDGNQIENTKTLIWTWKNQNYNYYRNFSFEDIQINVTETQSYSNLYDTSINILETYSTYVINKNENNRNINWNDTDAGGTVVFTNKRKTADVTIKKVLLPEELDTEEFNYSVQFGGDNPYKYESYELAENNKTITSGGTDEFVISDIPTGAQLIVTENADNDIYDTVVSAEGSSGTFDTNNKKYTFTVNEDTTLTFTNTKKKQKIKLIVTDENNNPLDSALFTFAKVFEGTKYSQENTGLVWEGEAYCGKYTLTETNMPNHQYKKLDGPVEVFIKKNSVTVPAGTENVVITYNSANDVYIIRVINPKLSRIRVSKEVEGDRTATFSFTATLTRGNTPVKLDNVIGTDGTDANGKISFTLVHNQTVTLYIPSDVKLTLVENLATNYETGITVTDDNNGNTISDDNYIIGDNKNIVINNVNKDVSIKYKNILRAKRLITLRKTTLSGGVYYSLDGGTFAIYKDNGTDPITGGDNLSAGMNGVFFTGEINCGDYIIKEIVAPSGYSSNDGKQFSLHVPEFGEPVVQLMS